MLSGVLLLALGQVAPPTAPMPITKLVSSVRDLAPGKPFVVALHMSLPKGWHNYYSNPGEAGAPTTIAWTLPKGYQAGPIEWPLPRRIVLAGVPMYGYEGDVWFTSTLTPPADAKVGSSVTIGAKAEWLLCSTVCVPQHASFHLVLGVRSRPVSAATQALVVALRKLPRRTLPWSVSAIVADKAVRLTVQEIAGGFQGTTFFPSDPDFFTADGSLFKPVPHGFELTVPISRYATKTPQRLEGILWVPSKGSSYWVNLPVRS